MDKKDFKSRLFNKKILTDDQDYWKLLLAEVLFRLQEIEQLNCPCNICLTEKIHLKQLINNMVKDFHIMRFRQPGFTGVGDCERTSEPLPPRA